MSRLLADRLRALVALEGPPWRLALALAAGVFISFTPLYGLQTVIALGTAMLFRLNAPAVLVGTWINLPWFAPFTYAAAVKLGAWLLPNLEGLAGMSAWLFTGTTLLGLGAAAVTFLVAFAVIRARRARRLHHRDAVRRRAA